MSSSSEKKLWSVLTYDLKTATDVCGIPCLVKSSSRTSSDELLLPLSTKIKIETELDIYTAHVRVVDYDDPGWIIRTKGRDCYNDRKQMIGCELLIPLGYPGHLKLCQNKKTKTYFNISEVAEDFPRLVRVEQDIACASPGLPGAQVVRKGTLLQLDRLTKSTKLVRGMSETFLMCFEVGTGKEYGFSLLSAIHFTEVIDTLNYTLKEIIDQLPLPRRVQFVAMNPYDVVVVDDEESQELLTIFSGPVEIIGIRRLELYVGLYRNEELDKLEMVLIPKDESLCSNILVHIPSSCLVDNDKTFADREIPNRTNRDMIKDKFYALYADDILPVFLNNEFSVQEYDDSDVPSAPPLPPRCYDPTVLTTAQSEPQLNDADKCGLSRKRFLSLGDVRRNGNKIEDANENGGFRGFFHSMSRRLTRKPTEFSSGTITNSPLTRIGSVKQSIGFSKSVEDIPKSSGSFICYINSSEDLSKVNHSVTASSDSINEDEDQTNTAHSLEGSNVTRAYNGTDFIYLDDDMDITNSLGCKPDNTRKEIIYASVSWKSKDYGVVQVRERFCCDICKTNFLNKTGDK